MSASLTNLSRMLRPGFAGWLVIIYTAACATLFVAGVIGHRNLLIDDAFITYRYAENIAAGHGIVWNIDGEPTEGYTSPLHVLLLVPAAGLGTGMLTLNRIAGFLISGAIVPVLLFAFAAKLRWPANSPFRVLALLVPGTWLAFGGTAVHAMSGMETSLVILLYSFLAWSIHSIASASRQGTTPSRAAWFLLFLLLVAVTLSRSEAGAVSAAAIFTLFCFRETRRQSLLLAGGFGCFLVLYLLWKKSYFGYVLPNPYYHKVAPENTLLPGLASVRAFLAEFLPFIAVPALAWFAVPPVRGRGLTAAGIFCALSFAFYTLFFLRVEHIMGYWMRFNWHSMPFLMFLVIIGLHRFAESPSSESLQAPASGWPARAVSIAGLGVWFLLVVLLYPSRESIESLVSPAAALKSNEPSGAYAPHWRIGQALKDLDLDYSTTISANEAGIIPFLTGTRSIDVVGLNDNVITRGTEEERRAYLAANPLDIDYTTSTSGALDDFAMVPTGDPAFEEYERNQSRELFRARYAADYYYSGHYRWDADPRRQWFIVWVRREHPRAQEIVQALRRRADLVNPANFIHGPYEEYTVEAVDLPAGSLP